MYIYIYINILHKYIFQIYIYQSKRFNIYLKLFKVNNNFLCICKYKLIYYIIFFISNLIFYNFLCICKYKLIYYIIFFLFLI